MQALCRETTASKTMSESIELVRLAAGQRSPANIPVWANYDIWWVKNRVAVDALRNAVGSPFNAEFFHAMPKRIRMHAERFGCSTGAFDHAVSLV